MQESRKQSNTIIPQVSFKNQFCIFLNTVFRPNTKSICWKMGSAVWSNLWTAYQNLLLFTKSTTKRDKWAWTELEVNSCTCSHKGMAQFIGDCSKVRSAQYNTKPQIHSKKEGAIHRRELLLWNCLHGSSSTSYFYQVLAVTQQEEAILSPSKALFDIKRRAQQLLLITQADRFAFSAHITPSIKLPG